MNILNKIKSAAAKEVIGSQLPISPSSMGRKGKMTLGALVLAIAGAVFEYMS